MNYYPSRAQINVQGCLVLTHSADYYVGRNLWICAIHAARSMDRAAQSMDLVGVLSDVNLHFIVQMFPLARIQFRTIQDM